MIELPKYADPASADHAIRVGHRLVAPEVDNMEETSSPIDSAGGLHGGSAGYAC